MDWNKFQNATTISKPAQEALGELEALLPAAADAVEGAVVRMAIANCLRNLGKAEEARKRLLEAYSALNRESEAYPRVMLIEALVEEDLGNWQKELAVLDEILSQFSNALQDPENEDLQAEVLRHRGIALLGLGRYTDAMPLLEAALSEEYGKDVTLSSLGQCYFELGQFEEAKKRFKQVLSIPLHPASELDIRYRLGAAHHRLGEYAWALQEFEWCVEHRAQGKLPERLIIDALVATLRALGKTEEAKRYSKTPQ
jgi:hypothetical protein